MAISKIKECVIIMWDGNFSVRAFCARKKSAKEILVLKTFSSSGTWENLASRLSAVRAEFNPSAEQVVILGGNLDGAFNVDLKIPKIPAHEIRNALSFELQRQLPLPVESLLWCYRISENLENSYRMRVFAVREEFWNKVLTVLLESGIKFDAFIHPAFCEDSSAEFDLDAVNHFYEKLMQDFSKEVPVFPSSTATSFFAASELKFNDDGAKQLDCGAFACRALFAHVLVHDVLRRIMSPFQVPQSLRPVRFKFLKISFLMLLLINILFAVTLCVRHANDARHRFGELKRENTKINAELLKIAQEDMLSKDMDTFMKRISGVDIGETDMVGALLSLTKNLPSYIWISAFNARGNDIELTILTRNENGVQAELSKLNSLPDFSNVSIKNTRRDRDGSLAVYLKLTYEKEGK